MIKGDTYICSLRNDPGILGPILEHFIPGWNNFINNYIVEKRQGRIRRYRPFWTKAAKKSFFDLGGRLRVEISRAPSRKGYIVNEMNLNTSDWIMFKSTFRTGMLIMQSDKLIITKTRDVSDSGDSVSSQGYELRLPEGVGTAIITALTLAGISTSKINL